MKISIHIGLRGNWNIVGKLCRHQLCQCVCPNIGLMWPETIHLILLFQRPYLVPKCCAMKSTLMIVSIFRMCIPEYANKATQKLSNFSLVCFCWIQKLYKTAYEKLIKLSFTCHRASKMEINNNVANRPPAYFLYLCQFTFIYNWTRICVNTELWRFTYNVLASE